MSLIRSDFASTSKPVIVIGNGFADRYPSISEAARVLGVDAGSIRYRLENDNARVLRTRRGDVCVDYALEAEA